MGWGEGLTCLEAKFLFYRWEKRVKMAEAMPTEPGADESAERRILVLGSAPHTRLVTAYTWNNLPPHLNVADYDVV